MNLNKKLEMIIDDAKLKLEEDSAFEKLLKVLTDYGMNEEIAAQMIADCIDEQYELDGIRNQLANIYQEAKGIDTENEDKLYIFNKKKIIFH